MVKRSSNRRTLVPVLMSLASASSALAQYSSSNTACTSHYVVQPGDTCDIIGQKTFTSTAQIMSLNLPYAGPSCFELDNYVQICLGTYGNDCQLVHRAIASDTCESITSQYNITTSTLLTNNAMLDCDQVYSGLMLCVIGGIIRPPAPIALNVSYDALSPGYTNENSTMPLGTPIVAVNAASLPPAPVQPASAVANTTSTAAVVSSSAATSATSATSSSASTGAATSATSSSSKGSSSTSADRKKAAEKTHSASHDTKHHAGDHKDGKDSKTDHKHKPHGHVHHAGHQGHKPKGHSHHAAAHKWQDSHT